MDYENIADAVSSAKLNGLRMRTSDVFDDDDDDDYDMPDEILFEQKGFAPSHPPPRFPSSSRRSSSSASIASGNSITDEWEYPFPSPCSSIDGSIGIGQRPSNASNFGRTEVRLAGGRGQTKGSSKVIEDGLNTAKLKNVKSGLHPTISSNAFVRNQNSSAHGNSDSLRSAPEAVSDNRGFSSRTKNQPVAKATKNTENDLTSREIENLRANLNPVPKKHKDSISSSPPPPPPPPSPPPPQFSLPASATGSDVVNKGLSRGKKTPPSEPSNNKLQLGNRVHHVTKTDQRDHVTNATGQPRTAMVSPRPAGKEGKAMTSQGSMASSESRNCPRSVTPSRAIAPLPSFSKSAPPKQRATRFASLAPAYDSDDSDDSDDDSHRRGPLTKALSEGHARSREALRSNAWQDANNFLDSQDWYFGDVDRQSCEKSLKHMLNENGSFVVRDSFRSGEDNPHALSVVFSRNIYHLLIRRRPDGRFSLGKPKPDEKVFGNVVEMINFHKNNAIELIGDSQKKSTAGKVVLTNSPRH